MFQFTREFIINDNKGRLKAGSNTGLKYVLSSDKTVLYIDNLVNLRKKDIVTVSVRRAVASTKAQAKLDFSGLTGSDNRVRVILKLGLDPERISAEVNDAYLNHVKEYFFEGEGTNAQVAQSIYNQMLRVFSMNNNEMFSASLSGTTITLDGRDRYVRFKDAVVLDLNNVPSVNGSAVTGYNKFTKLTGIFTVVKAGSVGTGTAEYLINNVKLPTLENVNPYNGQDNLAKPIPGALYDQYTVETVVERRHIGHQVAGSIDHSLSTFVFWVRKDDNCTCDETASPSAAFEAALAALGCTPVEIENHGQTADTIAQADVNLGNTLPTDIVLVNAPTALGEDSATSAIDEAIDTPDDFKEVTGSQENSASDSETSEGDTGNQNS